MRMVHFPFRLSITFALLLLFLQGCGTEDRESDSPETMHSPALSTDLTVNYSFDFRQQPQSISLPLDSTLREEFRRASHSYQYQGSRPPDGWRKEYYAMFLQAKGADRIHQQLLSELQGIAGGGDDLAEAIIAFVQGSISYDWQTFHNIDQSTIRYPYETLFDQTGVCADKTVLMAQLLRSAGYDVVFFVFERANHMALGLRVPAGMGDFRTDYAFVETTQPTPIGVIPDNYVGGIKLDRRPELIEFPEGGKTFEKMTAIKAEQKEWEKKYGKDYLFMSPDLRSLKEKMTVMQGELDELKKKMRGCRGTLPPAKFQECQALQQQQSQKVNEYNALVQRYNELGQAQTGPPA